jgi:PBP1b-binding outer membrane lipoprotein LpoB
MALQQNFGVVSWKTLVIVMSILFLTGCVGRAPETEIKTVVKIEKTTVPVVSRPKPLQLVDTRVRVVTSDTLDEFINEYKEQYGEVAFVVLSMKDYENLALNIADLRRYINQQTEIIVYYEEAVTEEKKEDGTESGESK